MGRLYIRRDWRSVVRESQDHAQLACAKKSAHNEIVKLVEKMVTLQKERRSVRLEEEFDRVRNLEREIAKVDKEIDRRVNALFGLAEEEIRVVEGK